MILLLHKKITLTKNYSEMGGHKNCSGSLNKDSIPGLHISWLLPILKFSEVIKSLFHWTLSAFSANTDSAVCELQIDYAHNRDVRSICRPF